MKVALINEGSSPNLGDQAINFTLVEILKENDCEVVVFPYSTVRNNNLKRPKTPTKKSNSTSTIKALIPKQIKDRIFKLKFLIQKRKEIINYNLDTKEFDVAIIGGGQLLNLNRTFPISLNLWTRILSKYNIPTVLFGVGYGESWKGQDKNLLLESLNRISKVYFRDKLSSDRIKSEFNVESNVSYDVVFAISDVVKGIDKKKKLITLLPASFDHVVRRYNKDANKDKYLLELLSICKSYHQQNYMIQLSITDVHQDYNIVQELSETLNDNNINHVLKIPSDLESLCNIISESEVIHSGRMHALIIGYSFQCKCIPYLLSEKLKTIKREILDKNIHIENIKTNIYSSLKNDILSEFKTLA